ncbi:PREDICTED: LEAF RUST 10 DISEASE-RESISTANCE LOCUS RECEPTOR-LIKE PROTEIN KINASE-like 1.2 [Nelumbo nucifera]|uniref:LEAF RUST 10 DISEASE-RESISTANCE LOCUS RECEPTOR-LIKE PROTEIN KINASE-like 1.2 n=1 Tax=Nelumbo nucifera TaxID=4432 RepID=A0A1U8QBS6_NELNU|nr:PREDICTED: LEAF RUST 10 DISEASE-RESISTANCE LOCUS RECEPTOR-LIKE PROTEIN KINASE-like 1.2 [Nelumbo nucifera]
MDRTNFTKLVFPVSINIIISIILFSTLVRKTQSADPKFEDYEPRNCGKGPNISYPFWIPSLQKSYCGYPNFEITCKNRQPVLNMSDDDYLIKDIFYGNHSLLVVNAWALGNETCPAPLHNFTLDRTPFEFGPDHLELFFLYNCTASAPASHLTFSVTCFDNNTYHHSFATIGHEWQLAWLNSSLGTCSDFVTAPIDMDYFTNTERKDYREYLRKGLLLEWTASNCSTCEESGRHCGFYNKEVVCFCQDGRYRLSCSGGKPIGDP